MSVADLFYLTYIFSLVKKHCFATVLKSFKGTIYQSFSTDLKLPRTK